MHGSDMHGRWALAAGGLILAAVSFGGCGGGGSSGSSGAPAPASTTAGATTGGVTSGATVGTTTSAGAPAATPAAPSTSSATSPPSPLPPAQAPVAGNLTDPDQPGAFAVGELDTVVPGASGDRVPARVYYPAATAGTSRAADRRLAPYPAVVYNHGFKPPLFAAGIDYRNNTFIAAWLASFGYVVICPDQAPNNDLFGTGQENATRDAEDARAALEHLLARSADPADALAGMIDPTRAALAGHSRGGDASLMAAAAEVAQRGSAARFKAIAVMGTPDRDPGNFFSPAGPLTFGDFTSVPTLIIGGSQDPIAPLAHQQGILSQSGPGSLMLQLLGGNHSQFKDSDAMLPGDDPATIPLATQHAVCRRYVTAWLGYFVKGEQATFREHVTSGGAIVRADPRVQRQTWR